MNLCIRNFILFICFFSGLVLADSDVLSGSVSSKSGISLYPHASVEYHKVSSGDEHQFLLSTPTRINNSLSIEKEALLSGDRNNILLRVKSSGSRVAAYSYYKQLFVGQGEVLYSCEERACGTSNYWANTIFNERKLYGRDSDQYYLAGRLKYGGVNYFLTVYIAKNGQKQEYIYLSYVLDNSKETKPFFNEVTSGLNSLESWQQGVPYINGALEDEQIAFMKQALRRDKYLSVWIVGLTNISEGQNILDEMNATDKFLSTFRAEVSQQLNINTDRIKVKNIKLIDIMEEKGQTGAQFKIYLL
jgi:hypothetical protein